MTYMIVFTPYNRLSFSSLQEYGILIMFGIILITVTLAERKLLGIIHWQQGSNIVGSGGFTSIHRWT